MYKMYRSADVYARSVEIQGKTSATALELIIQGSVSHFFLPGSKEAVMAKYQSDEDLTAMFSGGDYFVVGDDLVDYRMPEYKGFVHSDDSIAKLAESVGLMRSSGSGSRLAPNPVFNQYRKSPYASNVMLGGEMSSQDIRVDALGKGGDMSAKLLFKWSPFTELVSSVVEVLRLVCTNGMVANSPLFNAQVPIINRHEEHLKIAEDQVMSRFQRLITERLAVMGDERASVHDLMFIEKQLKRISSDLPDGAAFDVKRRIDALIRLVEPRLVGASSGSISSAEAMTLAGHLTAFDAWNCMTEIDSWLNGAKHGVRDEAVSRSLQARSNVLLFDRHGDELAIGREKAVPLYEGNGPEQAFQSAKVDAA